MLTPKLTTFFLNQTERITRNQFLHPNEWRGSERIAADARPAAQAADRTGDC